MWKGVCAFEVDGEGELWVLGIESATLSALNGTRPQENVQYV